MSEDLRPNRRIVFQGLGALGVAAALAACGGGTKGDGTGSDPTSAGTAGEELAKTADIPVGGGIILTDKHVVITQPTKGEFKAFTSICVHQGFDVGKVEDGTITCLRHGSTYDAATGEATGGPAPSGSALAEKSIEVKDDAIVAA